MVLLSKIDYDWFSDVWWILLILSVGAIGVTLIFGHGPSSDPSNRNWLSLGFVDIQPSELVKLCLLYTSIRSPASPSPGTM